MPDTMPPTTERDVARLLQALRPVLGERVTDARGTRE